MMRRLNDSPRAVPALFAMLCLEDPHRLHRVPGWSVDDDVQEPREAREVVAAGQLPGKLRRAADRGRHTDSPCASITSSSRCPRSVQGMSDA